MENTFSVMVMPTQEPVGQVKRTGIVRQVDGQGRVVLPIEIRQTMGISTDTRLDVRQEGQTIVIEKKADKCVFCEKEAKRIRYKGKRICAECLRLLRQEP